MNPLVPLISSFEFSYQSHGTIGTATSYQQITGKLNYAQPGIYFI